MAKASRGTVPTAAASLLFRIERAPPQIRRGVERRVAQERLLQSALERNDFRGLQRTAAKRKKPAPVALTGHL